MFKSVAAALLSIAAMTAPLAAYAQGTAAAPAAPPSYAHPGVNGEETIRGTVQSFDGKYALQVHDERGYVDNVRLHQGTLINPTGLTLAPGMTVTIYGLNRGSVFAANEIDTPYQAYGVYPSYPGFARIGFGPVFYHY